MRLLCSFLLALTLAARAAEPFEIKDGDRVLFLGDTLLEREGTYGYLETRMHEQFPDRHFTVRNLSWSGETPRGWSRASFDAPDKGWERLQEDIAKVRPTVVFLGYGMAASLQEMTDRAGDPALNPDPARYGAEPMSAGRFKKELGELMEAIDEIAAAQPVATPAKADSTGASVNGTAARGTPTPAEQSAAATTAEVAAAAAKLVPPPAVGTAPAPKVRFVLLSPIRHEDLRAIRPGLPDPTEHNLLLAQYTRSIEELARERGARFVSLAGLVEEAGKVIARSTPQRGQPRTPTDNGIHLNALGYAQLESIVPVALGWNSEHTGFTSPQYEAVSAAVIHKNALFFHRWRPANETYLFGFRKHEQGQNAREMAEFDPLIEQAEAEIDRLKGPGAAAATPTPAPAGGVTDASQVTPPGGPGNTPGTSGSHPQKVQVTPLEAPGHPPASAGSHPQKVQVTPLEVPGNTPASAGSHPQRVQVTLLKAPNPTLATSVATLEATPPLPRPDFTVEEGCQIELWAENPLLYKPTQMNWDALGRLWVTSSALYPMIAPGGQATDTVLVLEDTDHDGRADKSTVFAGGLLIPTGVVPTLLPQKAGAEGPPRYGCYVGQSTELLSFEDTDGDGVADTKRIVLSGFGTEDTHHIIHTLKWSPAGRLYFNQSVYIHSHVETPWGVVRLNSGGVFAYDPRTEKLSVFDKGLWNSWGHQLDEWGQHFQTDGAGSTGITWSFPGATFAPFEGARRTMASISPGTYPKFAGLELIHSPAFPADWQGNAITCDFRAHRVVRFGLTDLSTGEKPQAGYTTKEMPDLIRTSDVSFRPIDVKLGPDGALYIADWSNPVINHGEVDFRDPRRDHTHGRIWRVTRKDAPAVVKWEPLVGKPTGELLDSLLSGSQWAKEQARAVLLPRMNAEVQRTKEAAREARQLVLNDNPTDVLTAMERWYQADRNPAKLREACILESNVTTTGWSRFSALLDSPDPKLHAMVPRLMAFQRARRYPRLGLVPATPAPTPKEPTAPRVANLYALPRLIKDPDPRVRLETLRALASYHNSAQAISLVLDAAVKDAGDPFLDYAVWQTINDLAKPWTEAIAKGDWKVEGHDKQLEYGLNAIDPALAGTTLAKLLAEGKIALNQGPWIELIGHAGGPPELAALYESLILTYGGDCCPGRNMTAPRATTVNEEQGARIVVALLEAARVRNARPDGELVLADLAGHTPKALAPGLLQLAGWWKTKDALQLLPAAATGSDTAQRVAAIDGLRTLGGSEAMRVLESLCAKEQPFGIRRTALTALASLQFPAAASFVPAILHDAPTDNEALATWRGLLAVQGGADALAKQISEGAWVKDLPTPTLAAGVRAAREGGRKAQLLLAALTPLAGVVPAPTLGPADYQRVAERVKKDGDPAQGEFIYRRAASGCTICHAIGGAGGIVGPSLTSIGASAPLDYIIESLLSPNAKVKEGYNAVSLKLKDGTEATGIQARETAQEVILRNVAGQETAVPKANITGKTDVGSIMPAGLLEQFSEREQMNLYAFLGELGKPGPYDASKGSVARVWRLYSGAQETLALKQDVTNFAPPLYTLVDGRAPQASLLEALPLLGDADRDFYASAQFQVATAGKVRLHLTGISSAWLDGQPLAIASEPNPSVELAPGVHTLAVKLDRTTLPPVFRAEAEGVNFLGN